MDNQNTGSLDIPETGGLQVVTTHLNADFDGLASMMAAKKLYPEALLVFPGSQEQNLRNVFLQSTVYLYNFIKLKQIPLDRVERLILVDTRQPDRIGKFSDIVGRPDLRHPHLRSPSQRRGRPQGLPGGHHRSVEESKAGRAPAP